VTPQFVVSGERVVARLDAMPERVRAVVAREVNAFALDVTNIAKKKVSGDVLKVKTGRLRRSIHPEVKSTAAGVEGTVGTNVEYAARFELGFKGNESVRAFTRKQTQVFGRPIAPIMVRVSAYQRRISMAARPFLAPALNEATPPLQVRLESAVATALRAGL
jgi:phage gpG-like protein